MGDETRRYLPILPTDPVGQAGKMHTTLGIGVFDPQCKPATALDHRGLTFIAIKPQHTGAVWIVVAAQHTAAHRKTVDGHLGIGGETDLAIAHSEQTQMRRTHRQANTIVLTTPHPMGAGVQPMQPNQTGPTIGASECNHAPATPHELRMRILFCGRFNPCRFVH